VSSFYYCFNFISDSLILLVNRGEARLSETSVVSSVLKTSDSVCNSDADEDASVGTLVGVVATVRDPILKSFSVEKS